MKKKDSEDFIEIVPEGLTKSTTLQKAQLLIFKEKGGTRHLPILINTEEYRRVYQTLAKDDYSSMAPLKRLADLFNIRLDGVFFCLGGEKGELCTLLGLSKSSEDGDDEKQILREDIPNGLTAGLLMAAPFFISATTFNLLYNHETHDGQVAIPIAIMPEDLLQEALEQAVAGDNFELASVLRDEIKSRDAQSAH